MSKEITIYENVHSKSPFHISIEEGLKRIKEGKSISKVQQIRAEVDKERRNKLKLTLPSVCWSGLFEGERLDNAIRIHTGLVCLDFDHVEDLDELRAELGGLEYIYAFWVSPSGDGIKALAKIADTTKHREHYRALKEELPAIDIANINPARVCFESYDPDLYVNLNAKPFVKIIEEQKIEVKVSADNTAVIKNILTWLSNKNHAFVKGERNTFIFKFASACCRFGIDASECLSFCYAEYFNTDNSFSKKEGERTIQSAYQKNKHLFDTAVFEKTILVDKKTKSEVDVSQEEPEDSGRVKDVIYAEDVEDDLDNLYENGFENLKGIGISEVDNLFKFKRKESTLLSGYGNYGKSTFLKFMLLMRAILYGEKFAIFGPEDAPAEEFYFELTSIILGCSLTPDNPNRASKQSFILAKDFIRQHFFFVYPKDITPTPEYIKERFLKLVFTQKIDGIIIDPFNQLANDYSKSGGRTDKYLETFLSDFAKFVRDNNLFGLIIAHPKAPRGKGGDGNYECPDVFDIADGAMWNNKQDNILIYHKPLHQTNPRDPTCEFHTKKIRRKVVGSRGYIVFEYDYQARRFLFDGKDPMRQALIDKKLDFLFDYQATKVVSNQFPTQRQIQVNFNEIPF